MTNEHFEMLALAKKYVDETIASIGALKGKNCTITNVEENKEVIAITFHWLDDLNEAQETIIHITKGNTYDDTKLISEVNKRFESIYPVGSVYININDRSPEDILGFGKWQRIAKNKTLWGASNDGESNKEIKAGIPDISAKLNNQYTIAKKDGSDTIGAFAGVAYNGTGNYGVNYASNDWGCGINFKASSGETKINGMLKNDVYGKSDTVQPPALIVNIWVRIM